MDSLKETLRRNNYPENITSATINLDHKTEEDSRKLTTVCRPYMKGLAEKIQKICNPHDTRTTFRSESTRKEIPEEGWRAHRPKRCTDINKDEDNSPKNRNTTNYD